VNNDVEATAGDMVYNTAGDPVALEEGVTSSTRLATRLRVRRQAPVPMKQLVVTYKMQPYTWSDGTAGSIADLELGAQIDCDPDSGATTFITCNSIQDVTGARTRWSTP
jgi:hypothetical protein